MLQELLNQQKDFKAIPCKLYNPDKPELGVEDITEGAADRHHMFQTLVGDSSDNYKGCPSVGPVKANKILDDCDGAEETWEAVLKNFDKAGLSSKHALVQARLARILRHGEYDFETRKVKLWQPTKQK